METSPLDSWIAKKTGAREADALWGYQLALLEETLAYARCNSRHYRDSLPRPEAARIANPDDISRLPFTTGDMLADDPLAFVCAPLEEIGRIVTLPTSGTTGKSKRIFFTKDDLELAIDFFHRGMTSLARANDLVMIFLPGETEDGVGNLLKRGLERFGCEGIAYGPVSDYSDACSALASSGATCAVGLPAQLFALSRLRPDIKLRSVLLVSDYSSKAVMRALESAWKCETFSHYGLTESGLGGGVECSAHMGYHTREADLLFEIVDPATGERVPDGAYGEVVFTTLTRRGMPLIRYRTGDISRFVTEPCPCGSFLKLLERVSGRMNDAWSIGELKLSMPALDEALFPMPGLAGFSAELASGSGSGKLTLTLFAPGHENIVREAEERVRSDGRIGALFADGTTRLEIRKGGPEVLTYGNTKRQITPERTSSR